MESKFAVVFSDVYIKEPCNLNLNTLSGKKVQNQSLGLYLFKRYTFVPKGCILVP